MSKRRLATLALAVLLAPLHSAVADDTGLAVMHEFSREGGRTCFLDHFHFGTSAAQPSRKAAVKAALQSWSSFVDLEYGSDWARASRAASKAIVCETAANGWGCHFEARPCR